MGGPRLGDGVIEQAELSYKAGDFRQSRELAVQGLAAQPDDTRLLRLAGRSSLELDLDDAVGYLRRAAELAPNDGDAWRDLAMALMSAGDTTEGANALRQVVRLEPNAIQPAIDLAHLVHGLGRVEEAISLLSGVLKREPGNVPALRSLVEMYRAAGKLRPALAAAQEITRARPDDVVARLDTAQLNLALGNFTAATNEYGMLRTLDEPPHVAFAYHGMIQVELQRSNWRRALDHAIDATGVDRGELTTQVLAFTAARLFGDTAREVPTQEEIEAALAAEHLEHRRQHVEAWAAE